MTDDETPVATLTIEPAARYMSTSVNSLRRLVREGELAHSRYLGKLHFRVEDLDNYIDSHSFEAV